jgi:hypothetical protein
MVIDSGEPEIFERLRTQRVQQALVCGVDVDLAARNRVDEALKFDRIHRTRPRIC